MAFVGKLIVSKGVDLLLAAWPLVVARVPDARLCVVGFGTYRDGLHRLAAALGEGDLDAAREVAARGGSSRAGRLASSATWRPSWTACAPRLGPTTRRPSRRDARGELHRPPEHSDLPDLLPACEAQVVPSTFPEAFGMVAVEAAACGALPLSAAHSGLREVTRAFEPAVEPEVARLLSFDLGPAAVEEIASRLVEWLELPAERRSRARAAVSDLARERYGWERVAEGVVAAARGRLAELPEPRA